MLKLLLCVLSAAVLAALVLQLRQQRQELGYQTSRLHDEIKDQYDEVQAQGLYEEGMARMALYHRHCQDRGQLRLDRGRIRRRQTE